MVGGSIPRVIVLGSKRKQTEQGRGSKPHPPRLLHQFLTPGPSRPDFLQWGKYKLPFPPQLALCSWYFIAAMGILTKTLPKSLLSQYRLYKNISLWIYLFLSLKHWNDFQQKCLSQKRFFHLSKVLIWGGSRVSESQVGRQKYQLF